MSFDRSKVVLVSCVLGMLALGALAVGGFAQPAAQVPPDSLKPDTTAALGSAPSTAALPPGSVVRRDYLADVRAKFTPENRAYDDTKTVLRFVGPIYGILAALIILFSGFSAKMRDVARSLGRFRYVHVLVYFALYSIVGFVLSLPFDWYNGFAVEHQYHLSNQNFAAWFGDELKGLLVGIVFFGLVPLIYLAYGAIRRSPKNWWLWLGFGTVPVIVFAILITPIAIEPLFNKFTPLKNQELKDKILALAAKADIPGRKVFEVDKSAQTKAYNAYVTGFGASQRIVLWDTTLKGMTEDEILYVMGHEMGHYKLGHIWKGIAFFSALGFVFFFLLSRLCNAAIGRFGDRWGFRDLADIASLPLLVTMLNILTFLAQPAIFGYTRGVESQADVYGLEITHDNDAAARAFVKLGSNNKSNPDPSPAVRFWLYSHPTDAERVRLAMSYHPWLEGKPNRYFKPTP